LEKGDKHDKIKELNRFLKRNRKIGGIKNEKSINYGIL
jgi:hypothetical protein